jgi:hypothetical protein
VHKARVPVPFQKKETTYMEVRANIIVGEGYRCFSIKRVNVWEGEWRITQGHEATSGG